MVLPEFCWTTPAMQIPELMPRSLQKRSGRRTWRGGERLKTLCSSDCVTSNLNVTSHFFKLFKLLPEIIVYLILRGGHSISRIIHNKIVFFCIMNHFICSTCFKE